MKPLIKSALLGSLLICLGTYTQAQPAGMPPPAGGDMHAHMQDHMRHRVADIKAKLKLSPEQEGAWSAYIAAMKPPVDLKRPQRGEMEKLTTPERLDKMRALRKLHEAEMDKREDATRTFYASLTPEQKAIFDTNTGRSFHHHPMPEPRKP